MNPRALERLERLEPYLGDFHEAALYEGDDTALVCAVADRETLVGHARTYVVAPGLPPWLGRGDRGHGFGFFQIDDRGPYAYLPREAPEATPYLQARWACSILRDARRGLVSTFGPAFARDPVFEVSAICVYNAGLERVVGALREGRHPDHVTTDGDDPDREGDYGTDVLRRRDELRRAFPDRFPPVVGSFVA